MAEQKTPSFAQRLIAACSEMSNPKLDSTNPHFGNKFASLLAVSDVVRPALAKYGCAYRQSVECVGGAHYVFTYAYGYEDSAIVEKVLSTVPVTVDANPQRMGSALTYAKRYGLLAAFGLVGDEDDDAEAASTPAKPQKKASRPRAAAPKKSAPSITQAEKDELGKIAATIGDKQAVWAAFQANGIEGARALLAAAPEAVRVEEPPTYSEDVEF